ncbi:MAG: two-component regulator propeller domain-containing protein [Pseudomonadota bacterium]
MRTIGSIKEANRRVRGLARLCLRRALLAAPLLAALLCAAPPAEAGSIQRLRFSHLNVADGLPSTGIFSSYQDRQGFVWLGTQNGLARYDGRRFKIFHSDQLDLASLSDPLVLALLDDGAGNLWVGSRGGLDRIDLRAETIERQGMPAMLPLQERRVTGLAPAGPRHLWVACDGGLFLFDAASRQFSSMQPRGAPAATGQRSALLADGNGGVWFGQGRAVTHFSQNGERGAAFNTADGPAARRLSPIELSVRTLAFDFDQRLWVGMAGGAGTWTIDAAGAHPDALAERLNLPRAMVVGMLVDQERSLWIGQGGDGFLSRWRAGASALERIDAQASVPSSLVPGGITALMLDRNETLWVSTVGGGISLADLHRRSFSTYLSIPGDASSLSNPAVMASAPAGPQHVWVGTYGGGLNRMDLASGAAQRVAAGALSITQIKALLGTPDGQLWVGGEGGLQVYDPATGKVRVVELASATPAGLSISALQRDRRGQMWAASGTGLYRISPRLEVETFRANPQQRGALKHDVVDSLLEDRAGNLWIGTKGGLHRYDADSGQFEQPVAPSADLPRPDQLAIYAMRQDRAGRIWLATLQGLFELVHPNGAWQLKSWRAVPGMPKGEFDSLQDGPDDDLWLGNELGLTHFMPRQNLARHYAGLTHFDGGFNFNAGGRGPDGSVLFGGMGLLRIDAVSAPARPLAPQVVLSDLLVFNRSLLEAHEQGTPASGAPTLHALGIDGALHEARQVTLTHHEAMISFDIAALQFYDRDQNRYAWKLDGFDRDWIVGQGDQGMATYTNLYQGNYRLLARAAGPDGVWSAPVTLLDVRVLPPFWRTWWWYGGCALSLLLALAAAYRRRVSTLRRNQTRLEHEVAQRTRQFVEQKEVAEKARHDITLLSEIGREINASLDIGAIGQTLYAHVRELVNASAFGLGMVDRERRVIDFDFVVKDGVALVPYQRSLNATEQPAVQCVLEARELLINDMQIDARETDAHVRAAGGATHLRLQQAGAKLEQPRSGMYVPLMRKGEVIGVVTLLSPHTDAFGSADLDILRSLGAYAAVALDNADAYRRLKAAQSKLVQQEKLAALGSLVAGVAHELNTPLGNSLLMATSMREQTETFMQALAAGTVRKSDVATYCEQADTSTGLMVRNLSKAASLINSFKQLALERDADQRRSFDLRAVSEELVMTLAHRYDTSKYFLDLQIANGITLDGYPGAYCQVLSQLIMNAVTHGFEGRAHGRMTLQAEVVDGGFVRVVFEDDGKGIAPEHVGHVFEPFFTTTLGQGSNGLGMHLCYNIVQSLFGGSIAVSSAPGQGARFEMVLALVAPDAAVIPSEGDDGSHI